MTIGLQANQANPEITVNTMLMGSLSKDVAGGSNVILSEAEATYATIDFTGALTADIEVQFPSQAKWYLLRNSTSGGFSLSIKTLNNTPVILASGNFYFYWCDAVDFNGSTSSLTGVTLDQYGEVVESITQTTSTLTLDMSKGNTFAVTLQANVTTVAFSNVPAGKLVPITIEFIQDATGGRTVSGWGTAVKWSGGTIPTLSATANATDVVAGYTRDGGTTIRLDMAMQDSK